MRGYALGVWPPGFHVDEAFNVLDARAMLRDGWRPVFLPANAGRDALYSYLQAPLLGLVGFSIGNARLASALIGSLSVPVFWWTARQLLAGDPDIPPERLARLSLMSAGFAAFSLWHLHFSRFGIRAILFPPVVCAVVLAWWALAGPRGRPGDRRAIAGLGAALGLAFYTHPAGRGLFALPLAHALWLAGRRREGRPLKALLPALAIMLLVAAPLLAFWSRHPQTFTDHADEVSLLGAGGRALAANALKVLGMFSFEGDGRPWRNLVAGDGTGRPVFGHPVGAPEGDLFFTLLLPMTGLVTWLRAARRGTDWAAFAGLWLLAMLAPSMVTDQAPNFSRAIGALPPAFLLLACGLEWFPAGLLGRLRLPAQSRLEKVTWTLVALVFLLLFALQTWRDYAGWMGGPRAALAFDDDKVALAGFVEAEQVAGREVYLPPEQARHATVRALLHGAPPGFDAASGWVFPPRGGDGVYARLEPESSRTGPGAAPPDCPGPDVAGLEPARPSRVRAAGRAGDYPVAACRMEAGAVARWGAPFLAASGVTFGSKVRLIGVALRVDPAESWRFWPAARGSPTVAPPLLPGQAAEMALLWEPLAPLPADLNIAVQLVDAAGGGMAQADGPPLGAPGGPPSYPSEAWRPGEAVITRHRLAIPAGASGEAALRVGWYDWRTGEPLATASGGNVEPVAALRVDRPD
jgi:4-amino-4-deoxy-L-arabinose transferase-like glycosyltransferase